MEKRFVEDTFVAHSSSQDFVVAAASSAVAEVVGFVAADGGVLAAAAAADKLHPAVRNPWVAPRTFRCCDAVAKLNRPPPRLPPVGWMLVASHRGGVAVVVAAVEREILWQQRFEGMDPLRDYTEPSEIALPSVLVVPSCSSGHSGA